MEARLKIFLFCDFQETIQDSDKDFGIDRQLYFYRSYQTHLWLATVTDIKKRSGGSQAPQERELVTVSHLRESLASLAGCVLEEVSTEVAAVVLSWLKNQTRKAFERQLEIILQESCSHVFRDALQGASLRDTRKKFWGKTKFDKLLYVSLYMRRQLLETLLIQFYSRCQRIMDTILKKVAIPEKALSKALGQLAWRFLTFFIT